MTGSRPDRLMRGHNDRLTLGCYSILLGGDYIE
jgi:hypothetical protein